MSETVIVKKQGRAGRITLNRPESLHALNTEMCEIMTEALLSWVNDPEVEFILVDHLVETRGFCAGGDVILLHESGKGDGAVARDFFKTEYRLNTLIKEYPKPYVSMMDGVTMGGGVGISVHGSHRIATDRSLFAMPESGIGLIPDVGGGFFLPRLTGGLGMWLALTGDRLKGADVLAVGVATHYANSEDIADLSEALCDLGLSALDSLQTEASGSYETHRQELDAIFNAASVEAIIDELCLGSDWAQSKADTLSKKSPLTLKVAHRQLDEGATLSFREVMQMEYRLATRMIHTPSFQEGIRALLIDKDKNPQWEPSSLAAVSQTMVDDLFAPVDDELTFLDIL